MLRKIHERDDMTATKPARRFIAQAVPNDKGSGYLAVFALPGTLPDYVMDGDNPAVYANEQVAEYMALRVLFNVANAKSRYGGKNEISHKMSGAEFAAELAETGIPITEFSQLWGTSKDRVSSWVDGVNDVPFPLRWILKILRLPGVLQAARVEAARHIEYKQSFIEHSAEVGSKATAPDAVGRLPIKPRRG